MYIYTTYINKNSDRGKIIEKANNNLESYLLGLTSKVNLHTIKYIPQKITYATLLNFKEYIKYLYHVNFKRIDYYDTIISNNNVITFFECYESFIKTYPTFLKNKKDFYTKIIIPKKKSGYRTLYKPHKDLAELQRQALFILNIIINVKEHDAAYAYVSKRSSIDNAKRHQYAKHLIKTDLRHFFDSITTETLKNTLLNLREFAIINTYNQEKDDYDVLYSSDNLIKDYAKTIRKFFNILIEIATLNNRLIQGTCLSPKLSNLVMVPFDYHFTEYLKTLPRYVTYTRYADDIFLSSFYPLNKKEIMQNITSLLPKGIYINDEKTKYLRNTTRLYITGVKINNHNKLTYGHEKTKQLKQDLFKLLINKQKGEPYDRETTLQILGKLAYAKQIQPKKFDELIRKYSIKFHVDPKYIYKYLLN